MARRLDEQVVRGRIDNRQRGRVVGTIWFTGRTDPLVLDLRGDAWRDLAGHCLEFVNPHPQAGGLLGLDPFQVGRVGDITASRKVKVPEVSAEELRGYLRRREAFPWHWGNSLYLEWYSETDGRVVIESTSYRLTVGAGAAWTMSAEEEAQQRRENAQALEQFLVEATAAAAREPEPESDRDAEVDALLAEAERTFAESERLSARVRARLEQEGPDADLGRIMAEEIDRARRERGQPDLTPEERALTRDWVEAARADLGDESLEDDAEEPPDHPLTLQAQELSLRVLTGMDRHGWMPDGAPTDHPVMRLLSSIREAGGKVAGALGGHEWPPPRATAALNLVWLQRARSLLAEARPSLARCRAETAIDPAWLESIGRDVDALVAELDAVGAELRQLLERGFD